MEITQQEWLKALKVELYTMNPGHEWYTYENLMNLDRKYTKQGMPLCPAYWNCPVCKICWRDCPHTIYEAYPSWEDRPWKQ